MDKKLNNIGNIYTEKLRSKNIILNETNAKKNKIHEIGAENIVCKIAVKQENDHSENTSILNMENACSQMVTFENENKECETKIGIIAKSEKITNTDDHESNIPYNHLKVSGYLLEAVDTDKTNLNDLNCDKGISQKVEVTKFDDLLKNETTNKLEIVNTDMKSHSKFSQNITLNKMKTRNSKQNFLTTENKFAIMKIDKRKMNRNSGLANSKPRTIKEEHISEICDTPANIFEINIPFKGKSAIIDSDEKPFNARYDLAREINEKRFRHMQKEGYKIPEISYENWKKERNERTDKEKEAEETNNKIQDLRMAYCVSKISIQILKLLDNDTIDEKLLQKKFLGFLSSPVSPKSLLYVPHFVHTIMFCRGYKCLSRHLRALADDCFQKCHAMFPVPSGSNFESVYSAEVKRTVPVTYDQMDSFSFDYEDFSDTESETSEIS